MRRRKGPAGGGAAAQQQDTAKAEVLELVVTFTNDCTLLAKATILSSYYQEIALSAVKQRLPCLLVHAVKRAAEDSLDQTDEEESSGAGAVRWLCAAAGPEVVGKPEVAAALLSEELVEPASNPFRRRQWAWGPFHTQLAGAGVTLSDALVASAARQQLPQLRHMQLCYPSQRAQLPPTQAPGGLSKLFRAAVQDDAATVKAQLQAEHTSAATVTDLLFIAANNGCRRTFRALLDHDELHTRVLVGGAGAAASPRGPRSKETGRGGSRGSSGSQPDRSPQQQPAQVIEQLMLTCVAASHIDALCWLVDLPAAADLGTGSVTKLMHAAALRGNAYLHYTTEDGYWRHGTNSLALLSQLPAAQDISPATISSLVRTVLHAGETSNVLLHLLALPPAYRLTSSQVCELLLLAIRKHAWGAIMGLTKLAAACNMQRDDVMALLLTTHADDGSETCCELMHILQDMQLSRLFSAEEVLSLLPRILRGTEGLAFAADPPALVRRALGALAFSSREFKQPASFVAFLDFLVSHTFEEFLDEMIDLVLDANSGPPLGLQHYLQLLRCCIAAGKLPGRFLCFPACDSVSAGHIAELMQLCFKQYQPQSFESDDDGEQPGDNSADLVPVLAGLPHARDLTAKQILHLMRLALRAEGYNAGSEEALESLAALPLARQISKADARALVLAAFDGGELARLRALCKCLPACAAAWEGVDPGLLQQRVQRALQAAADGGKADTDEICVLLQHPMMQQQAADVLPAVLLAGFQHLTPPRQPRKLLAWFSRAPKQNAGEGMQLQLSRNQVLQLLQLPAAASLTTRVVCELMQQSVVHMDGDLLQELVRLPGAQQLSEGDVVLLLRSHCAAGQGAAGTAGTTTAAAAAAAAGCAGTSAAAPSASNEQQQQQQQQPVQGGRQRRSGRGKAQQKAQSAKQQQQHDREPGGKQQQEQQEGPGLLTDLVAQCLRQPRGAAVLFPLLLLPWAQQLPGDLVRTLLQAAVERQARAVFERLLRLPQAPRGDPEVAGFVEVMRFCSAAADLCDFGAKEGGEGVSAGGGDGDSDGSHDEDGEGDEDEDEDGVSDDSYDGGW